MTIHSLYTAALSAIVLTACSLVGTPHGNALRGSGTYITREFRVRDFSGVEAGGGFKVTITHGDAYRVTITAEDNIMDVIRVEKSGGVLHIRMDTRQFTTFSTGRLEADISMPMVTKVEASGGSRFAIAGFNSAQPFNAVVSGGSKLTGDIGAGTIDLESNGGGSASLNGTAGRLTLHGSGGGRLDLGKLATEQARVSLSGGADATVRTRRLDYDLSGGAKLRYYGQPVIGNDSASGGAAAIPIGP